MEPEDSLPVPLLSKIDQVLAPTSHISKIRFNIIRATKSRRLCWARYVARMTPRRGAYRVLMGKPEGKRPLGNPGVDAGNVQNRY
jgi:hypothetical protein